MYLQRKGHTRTGLKNARNDAGSKIEVYLRGFEAPVFKDSYSIADGMLLKNIHLAPPRFLEVAKGDRIDKGEKHEEIRRG